MYQRKINVTVSTGRVCVNVHVHVYNMNTEFTLKHFFSISTGLFNAGDKVLIALEIFLVARIVQKRCTPLNDY